MKWVFILCLGVVAGVAGLLGFNAAVRWSDNMTQTARVVPGERVFRMPPGVVPRDGELTIAREDRARATRRSNPVPPSAASVAEGKVHYVTFCAPCHGSEAKGGITGPVALKFIPPPDLTLPELQRQRTDGYWQHYIVAGGAVMPAYGETLSSREAWHVVNYLRSLAAR